MFLIVRHVDVPTLQPAGLTQTEQSSPANLIGMNPRGHGEVAFADVHRVIGGKRAARHYVRIAATIE